jgi:crossover junction endodeoxyribonuclease RuvC
MTFLSFDPGFGRLGVAVVKKENGKEKLIFSECFETDQTLPHANRLLQIKNRVVDLITEYTPTHMALETLFFNVNIKTAIKVAEARGVLLALAAEKRLEVVELGPQEIKLAVTGYGNSRKQEVQKMVKFLYPEHFKKVCHDDEFDAVAVGISAIVKASSRIANISEKE